eukprot:1501490-Prymnesium_polylepis.2
MGGHGSPEAAAVGSYDIQRRSGGRAHTSAGSPRSFLAACASKGCIASAAAPSPSRSKQLSAQTAEWVCRTTGARCTVGWIIRAAAAMHGWYAQGSDAPRSLDSTDVNLRQLSRVGSAVI